MPFTENFFRSIIMHWKEKVINAVSLRDNTGGGILRPLL